MLVICHKGYHKSQHFRQWYDGGWCIAKTRWCTTFDKMISGQLNRYCTCGLNFKYFSFCYRVSETLKMIILSKLLWLKTFNYKLYLNYEAKYKMWVCEERNNVPSSTQLSKCILVSSSACVDARMHEQSQSRKRIYSDWKGWPNTISETSINYQPKNCM